MRAWHASVLRVMFITAGLEQMFETPPTLNVMKITAVGRRQNQVRPKCLTQ
jgi:hypothetical protein